ncbi:putative baseplate protein [Acinetobacter phage vB_AbaM_D22]|nr:putative baseplate protein [Acinetobacter phage vB_AbaM_D22]
MAVLNDKGVEIQKLEGILQDLQNIARRKFADILKPDDALDVSDVSVLGRILGIVAEPEALNEELLLMLWQTLDPEQANGVFLDKILSLTGIFRKGEIRGFAGLILQGTFGVTVPERSLVSSPITGDIFETTASVKFTLENSCGLVLEIPDTIPDKYYALGYTGSYGQNKYPTISTRSVQGDTKNMIARRFAETLNSSSQILYATVNDDDNVVVRFLNLNTVGYFSIANSNFRVKETFMPASSISVTSEAGTQMADTLTVMQTPVIGWVGVTNPFDTIPSEPKEDDSTFRLRGKVSKSAKSTSNRTGLYTDLYALNGVRYVNIQENIYDNPTGGRSAKGISVVVLGGDDQEIGQVIKDNIPTGCLTDGLITVSLPDAAGEFDVHFSRPEYVPIQIKLSLEVDSLFPQNGKVLIQEALVRYFDSLEVGDDVVWSKLFNPINEVAGQSVTTLLIGKRGETLQQGNIVLNYNQLPIISFEDIAV